MKNFLALLLIAATALMSAPAYSATLTSLNNDAFRMDRGNLDQMSLGTTLVKAREHSVKCIWDRANQTGLIGLQTLKTIIGTTCTLPNKAIIRDVLFDVVTAPVGASATISFGLVSAVDLKAATAITSFTLGALVAGIPVGTAASAIKLAADKNLTMTIATTNLSAGKINVQILYQLSE